MTDVTQIHSRPLVPELSVFELAVARAMTRPLVGHGEQVHTILCDWFLQDVRVRDIEAALRSMARRGFLTAGAQGAESCALTEDGIMAVTTLYGGCIRMIDRVPANFSLLPTPGGPDHA